MSDGAAPARAHAESEASGQGRLSGAAGRRAPLAAAAGFAFLLLVVALSGPIAPMGITTALCGVLTLAWLASPAARAAGDHWPRTPVDLAAIAWLLALVVASVFAMDPAGSFPRVTKGLMPALVGLAAFHAAGRRDGRRALAVWLAAVGIVAAIGLAAWVSAGAGYAWRARGLAHHYMTFGGQLLLEFPVALALAFTTRGRWRLGAAAVALLTAAALATTFTRSAWLGTFAASVVVLAGAWPLGLGLLAAGAAGAWFFAGGEWGDRIRGMFDPAHGYNSERLLMWEAGGRMFRSDPVTGVGLQDMHAVYPLFRSPQATEEVGHLHSTFVQIAASMGILGLAAFAWLYAAVLRAASAALVPLRGLAARLRAEGPGAGLRLGVTASLVGFLVAGLFEWNFGDEELLYHLYVLVGMAWASRKWER